MVITYLFLFDRVAYHGHYFVITSTWRTKEKKEEEEGGGQGQGQLCVSLVM